jgi:hypothetical protein
VKNELFCQKKHLKIPHLCQGLKLCEDQKTQMDKMGSRQAHPPLSFPAAVAIDLEESR